LAPDLRKREKKPQAEEALARRDSKVEAVLGGSF
jgi:hypothetical protein